MNLSNSPPLFLPRYLPLYFCIKVCNNAISFPGALFAKCISCHMQIGAAFACDPKFNWSSLPKAAFKWSSWAIKFANSSRHIIHVNVSDLKSIGCYANFLVFASACRRVCCMSLKNCFLLIWQGQCLAVILMIDVATTSAYGQHIRLNVKRRHWKICS